MKRRSVKGSRIFLRTRINHGTSSRSVFGAEKKEDKRDDERRRWPSRPCPKFHASLLLFSPMADACACYGHHAALLPSGRGEMITTPNRLRGEILHGRVCRGIRACCARRQRGRGRAKGVLKLVAERPVSGPCFSRSFRRSFVRSF